MSSVKDWAAPNPITENRGGLIGKVSKVTDTEVEIELAPTVKVRALKGTLSSVTPRGAPAAANDAKG